MSRPSSRRSRSAKRRRSSSRARAEPAPRPRAALPLAWGLGAGAALVALVVVTYASALDGDFVYDDRGSIVENVSVHWRTLGLDELRAAWLHSPTRRFVANWSFGLDHLRAGLDASAFHATSVALHALTSLLVLGLLVHLLGMRGERDELSLIHI